MEGLREVKQEIMSSVAILALRGLDQHALVSHLHDYCLNHCFAFVLLHMSKKLYVTPDAYTLPKPGTPSSKHGSYSHL